MNKALEISANAKEKVLELWKSSQLRVRPTVAEVQSWCSFSLLTSLNCGRGYRCNCVCVCHTHPLVSVAQVGHIFFFYFFFLIKPCLRYGTLYNDLSICSVHLSLQQVLWNVRFQNVLSTSVVPPCVCVCLLALCGLSSIVSTIT